jgi:hypothetical protein
MPSSRTRESTKAAKVLREIFDAQVKVPGVTVKQRDEALHLAIMLLEARAVDADGEEG